MSFPSWSEVQCRAGPHTTTTMTAAVIKIPLETGQGAHVRQVGTANSHMVLVKVAHKHTLHELLSTRGHHSHYHQDSTGESQKTLSVLCVFSLPYTNT